MKAVRNVSGWELLGQGAWVKRVRDHEYYMNFMNEFIDPEDGTISNAGWWSHVDFNIPDGPKVTLHVAIDGKQSVTVAAKIMDAVLGFADEQSQIPISEEPPQESEDETIVRGRHPRRLRWRND